MSSNLYACHRSSSTRNSEAETRNQNLVSGKVTKFAYWHANLGSDLVTIGPKIANYDTINRFMIPFPAICGCIHL